MHKLWPCVQLGVKYVNLPCDTKIKKTYTGGVYHPKPNVFTQLAEANISIPQNQNGIFRFLDMSSFSRYESPQLHEVNLRYIEKHVPLDSP